jgi:hypothetical protein
MLELRPAQLDDVCGLFGTAADPAVRTERAHWRRWVQYHLRAGPCYCAYYQKRLVGAGGIDLRHPGVGTPWVVFDGSVGQLPGGHVPTVESLAYLEQAMASIRLMLEILCRRFSITRLHTDSYKDFPASQRLLKHLGFERLRRETADRYFYAMRVRSCHQQ